MPMVCGRYVDDDTYADMRAEAAREEYDDACDATCSECGERWVMGWIRATRYQPGEPRQPECPACGGDPVLSDW